ncbi:hypothetical protein TNCV_3048021 [Trichonephila clavipes]|nr:hypothetical protein TNCV_3048021 [Trichonephila clavipes]
MSPQCLKPIVKYPTKVMVWGCMSSRGVGRLHIVSGTVKAMDYIEILQNKLLPTATFISPPPFLFGVPKKQDSYDIPVQEDIGDHSIQKGHGHELVVGMVMFKSRVRVLVPL